MSKYNIPDYFFEKFCECETYDIRQYITNKQTKFNLSSAQPQHFPSWFLNFKYLRGEQFIGWALFAGAIVGAIYFITLISLACTHLTSQWHIYLWRSCWFFFALVIVLLIMFVALYLHSYFRYQLYNKTYLKKYLTVFKQMQTAGYVEPDLSKYPETLQMAFYSRSEWKQKKNQVLKHYCQWFGILSLEKFFYDYDKQQFPINMNLPFNNWFLDYCLNKQYHVH